MRKWKYKTIFEILISSPRSMSKIGKKIKIFSEVTFYFNVATQFNATRNTVFSFIDFSKIEFMQEAQIQYLQFSNHVPKLTQLKLSDFSKK